MSVNVVCPSTSNNFFLSLENDVLNVLNNNNPFLVFKNNGYVKNSSPLYDYDNSTGYVTLNKKGKYLLTTNLYIICNTPINTGGVVVRYGSGESSTSSHIQSITSVLQYSDFNINGTFIITCDNEGSDVAFVSLANATNTLLGVLGSDPITSVSASYMQLCYLGP